MKTLTLLLALASATALAFPAGEVTFLTRDGRALRGRILAETPQGYLVAGPKRTELLLYGNISDMRAAEDVAQPQPVLAPPPPPPPAPPAVAAAPEPLPAPQYPQPARPQGWVQAPPAVSSSGVEEVPQASTRLGFHVGVGAGLMFLPLFPYNLFTANAQLNLDWTFGVVGVRITPTLTFYEYYNPYVAISADTKVHFNIGDIFALGVGVDLGGALGGGGGLYLGASVAPAIFKLGSRGQHQVALQVSVPVIVTTPRWSYFGMPMASVGYNYLF